MGYEVITRAANKEDKAKKFWILKTVAGKRDCETLCTRGQSPHQGPVKVYKCHTALNAQEMPVQIPLSKYMEILGSSTDWKLLLK